MFCAQSAHALDFTPKFQITTDAITTAKAYNFAISAKGAFYVDCGGGVLKENAHGSPGNAVSTAPLITQSSTGYNVYWCDFPVNSNGYTVSFGGDATEYLSSSGSTQAVSAITFYTGNSGKQLSEIITGMSGSLSAIFPTIDDGSTLAKQPRFIYSFYNANKFTGPLPSTLFSGLSGQFATYMFRRTFYNNSSLMGYIPYNFFGNLDPTGASMSKVLHQMFYSASAMTTYSNCPSPATENFTLSYAGSNNSNLQNKAVCRPTSGCATGEYEYNSQCYAKCAGTNMNSLKTSSGLIYNMIATKVTTPAINIQSGNTTCYIPLETGAGTSPALNIQHGNTTYHAVSLN